MKPLQSSVLALAFLVATPLVPEAQEGGMDHSAMHGGAAMADMDSPASKAFMAATAAMHRSMDMEMTGDPDLDFLQGMIPHHEGAVAMAKVELEYGKDERVRELARKVVADQGAEIDLMRRLMAEKRGAAK
jgi:uncharacterized protein (DUF305 family)